MERIVTATLVVSLGVDVGQKKEAGDGEGRGPPFTREGFFRLKSIRIISPRSCWFLSKVHGACELGIDG